MLRDSLIELIISYGDARVEREKGVSGARSQCSTLYTEILNLFTAQDQELEKSLKKIERLTALVESLTKVLQIVNTVSDGYADSMYCPWCYRYSYDNRHETDCPRQVVLRAAKKMERDV